MNKLPKESPVTQQNRESINDIEQRLVKGLDTQERLIDEVHTLQTEEHIMKRVIATLAVAVLLSFVSTAASLYAVTRADKAIYQIETYHEVRGGGGQCSVPDSTP